MREDHARIVDAALAAFGLVRTAPLVPVPDSVLNFNYRAETTARPGFVRLHKANRTRERLELEHRMIRWAGDRGIPVNAPLLTPRGESLLRIGETFVAVFPWLEVRTAREGRLTLEEARTLGEMHGLLHAVLAGFSDAALATPTGETHWNTRGAIETLRQIEGVVRAGSRPDPLPGIRGALLRHIALLESEALGPAEFAALPLQPCHGDYHARNVLLGADGAVAAVVDWERVRRLPRALELCRALSLVGVLEEPGFGAYLGGYRRHATLEPVEVRLGVEMWWQNLLHDTWVYQEWYLGGDERTLRFFAGDLARREQFAERGFRERLAERLIQSARS